MKNLLFRAAAVAALLMPLAVTPATAQNWKWDIGLNGGGSFYTTSLSEEHTGVGDMRFKPGWLLGGQLTFWMSPSIGLRGNMTYSERPFDFAEDGDDLDTVDDSNVIDDVNLWSYSGDLLFRFKRPAPVFEGSEFLPYLAVGVGIKTIHPGVEESVFTSGDGELEGIRFPAGSQFMVMEHGKKLLGLVGLGGDWRTSPGFAVRLEVGDRMWDTPIHTLTGAATVEEDDIGKVVHELYGQIGLHLLMGLEEAPAPVVVAPPPPPPAAPAPPPAPREEAITVCVIDPSSPMGFRMVSATYMPDTRDTLVTVNGNRVELSTTTGNVVVASNADWFVRGEPLAIGTGNTRMEFVTFGTSRLIEGEDLAYLGTVRGVPVYADRDEVAEVMEDLAELRQAEQGTDLEQILEEQREVRDELDDLGMLYVPLQPTGCVFQPLQRSQEVRKGGK